MAFQPLIDKIDSRLAGWKGKHFTRAGRVTLSKSVLAWIVTYHLIAFFIRPGVLKQINKLMRTFIWMRQERPGQAPSSLSLVNWSSVCRPHSLGGLGIPNLAKFGRARRLRWPWFSWADPGRPWIGLISPCTLADMDLLFRASTRIQLGNRAKALFWHDP